MAKAKYKNNVEFIQFDGTNQEAVKEFTGSSYVDIIEIKGQENRPTIQFDMNGQRQQIYKDYYVLKDDNNWGIFDPITFEKRFEVIND
jgi:hypothetical protein